MSNIKTRNYEEGDEHRLLKIYDNVTKNLVGTVKRDTRYWRRRYKQVFSYNGFFYEEFNPENIIVSEGSKGISGYCFNNILGGMGYITELLTQKPYCENTRILFNSLMKRFSSRHVQLISLFCPKNTKAMKCLERLLSNGLVESHIEAYMVKILNPHKALEAIRDEICARAMMQSRLDIVLELAIEGKSTFLSIRGQNVEIRNEMPAQREAVKISLTNQGFARLIFGLSSPRKLHDQGHVFCSTDSFYLLSRLFPRKACYLFPGDFW
jgi:predicted acetyltransferase